eukprot:scaffold369_cov56-Prasinocladus_malaysianus.AAC.1
MQNDRDQLVNQHRVMLDLVALAQRQTGEAPSVMHRTGATHCQNHYLLFWLAKPPMSDIN